MAESDVTVSITYAAEYPAPIRYQTRLTTPSRAMALLHIDETAGSFEVSLPNGCTVHQETTAVYADTSQNRIQVKDFVVGGASAPRQLQVTFDGVCIPSYLSLQLVVADVENEDEEVPTPNGTKILNWNSVDQEWQFIQQEEEWAPNREGFLFGITCDPELGYYRRIVVHPSGEPIGGGYEALGLPVLMDSGGAGFNDVGVATVNFKY